MSLGFCQFALWPLYARTFHLLLMLITALRLHCIRAAISPIVISVVDSNRKIRSTSCSLKARPCTAIFPPTSFLGTKDNIFGLLKFSADLFRDVSTKMSAETKIHSVNRSECLLHFGKTKSG